jgi:hypothetical protein
MELAEWLSDRVRCAGIRTPLATLFGRAITNGGRTPFGSTWTDAPITSLGNWTGTQWQEVARLADLASNRETMSRLLMRRSSASVQAVSGIEELLGATEEEFRERAGWEWVLEAALRKSRQEQVEVVGAFGTVYMAPPVDTPRIPAAPVAAEWLRPAPLVDMPLQHASGA